MNMRISKRLMVWAIFIITGLYSSLLYADSTTGANIKAVTVIEDDKKVDVLMSEDEYVRITQPTKVNTSTFESKINIMGEAKFGTNITIEVGSVSTDKDNKLLPKLPKIYELNTVGVTETFNQLIELFEGQNEVVFTYTNEKDKRVRGSMSFMVTREPEETKESLKTYIAKPGLMLENVSKLVTFK